MVSKKNTTTTSPVRRSSRISKPTARKQEMDAAKLQHALKKAAAKPEVKKFFFRLPIRTKATANAHANGPTSAFPDSPNNDSRTVTPTDSAERTRGSTGPSTSPDPQPARPLPRITFYSSSLRLKYALAREQIEAEARSQASYELVVTAMRACALLQEEEEEEEVGDSVYDADVDTDFEDEGHGY